MTFASFEFLALLFMTVVAYWSFRQQPARLAILIIASFVFYAWRHWPSLFLLVATIGFNYLAGRFIETRRQRKWLALSIGVNLLALVHFKYSHFFLSALVELFTKLGLPIEIPATPRWLPLGISFFTFQVIAYLVDVYRGVLAAEKSPLVFAVFKCFFAQLVAGPIVKGADLLPQLRTLRAFDAKTFHQGLILVILGVSMKLSIADAVAPLIDNVYANIENTSRAQVWLAIIGYSVQLFADFWGYSTVAVGVGFLFGIDLPFNFAAPYLSTSVQDFWRRWHVTLSSWFRDYLYIPLGGNRSFPLRNIVLTMTIAGLWHGASWNFVLWGFLHGVWLAVERLVSLKPPKMLAHLQLFLGVSLLWVLFRAETLTQAFSVYARAFTTESGKGQTLAPEWPITIVLFLLFHGWLDKVIREERAPQWSLRQQLAFTFFWVWAALAYAGAPHDFIYFVF